jgi:hypothetical protein
MNVELPKELSETDLHQVSGGGAGRVAEIAADSIDGFWDRFLGVHDSQGRGIIHHFIDSGAHYK